MNYLRLKHKNIYLKILKLFFIFIFLVYRGLNKIMPNLKKLRLLYIYQNYYTKLIN